MNQNANEAGKMPEAREGTIPGGHKEGGAPQGELHRPQTIAGFPSGVVSNRKAMKAADRKLAYAVRKGIEHVKGLDATHIAIVARGGNVTLTGTVPQEEQIGVAVERAKAVPGVNLVINRLAVGEEGP